MTKFLVSFILSLCCLSANAKPVAELDLANGNRVVLFDEQRKCPEGFLYGEYVATVADLIAGPRTVGACWAFRPGNMVLFQDDEGDSAEFPVAFFRPVKEI